MFSFKKLGFVFILSASSLVSQASDKNFSCDSVHPEVRIEGNIVSLKSIRNVTVKFTSDRDANQRRKTNAGKFSSLNRSYIYSEYGENYSHFEINGLTDLGQLYLPGDGCHLGIRIPDVRKMDERGIFVAHLLMRCNASSGNTKMWCKYDRNANATSDASIEGQAVP